MGSRTRESADRFAEEFGIKRRHASCEALAADEQVDIAYVATPRPMHLKCSLTCLEHWRHVRCEKPLAMDAGEGAQMADCARRNGQFLMEDMWSLRDLRRREMADTVGKAYHTLPGRPRFEDGYGRIRHIHKHGSFGVPLR